MYLENVNKCLKLFSKVYVSSDDPEILRRAKNAGARPISRGLELCGTVPNIQVYKHALTYMGAVDGIIAVQACSPNIEPNLIMIAKKLMKMGVEEVMTCHEMEHGADYHGQHNKVYGSIWGISRNRLEEYGDPYKPNPEVLLVDKSIDIHTQEDYELAMKQSLCQR